MNGHTARRRRRRRWELRESAAGRTAQAGYGNRDVGSLLRRITWLREHDADTFDDLDRYILETYGS